MLYLLLIEREKFKKKNFNKKKERWQEALFAGQTHFWLCCSRIFLAIKFN
jgi:hypothetical protein